MRVAAAWKSFRPRAGEHGQQGPQQRLRLGEAALPEQHVADVHPRGGRAERVAGLRGSCLGAAEHRQRLGALSAEARDHTEVVHHL